MPQANENGVSFQSLQIGVLTVSDSRDLSNDKSGDLLIKMISATGHVVKAREIIRDDLETITNVFRNWSKKPEIDVIISTGGTGVTGRDVTPEALSLVAEKKIDGFGELFRWLSYQKIGTSTIQSRADAGVLDGTYIFVLPGSPGACRDAWEGILKDQLDIRHRPCNFAELIPRLKEQ